MITAASAGADVARTAGVRADAPRGNGAHVCMLAYTYYPNDARVRREAETLAAHGYQVRCLTIGTTGAGSTFTLDGVEVRELAIAKYRGKSRLAYAASYLRFLLASSVACVGLLWRRELDVLHVHNVPDFLVFAGLVPRLFGVKVVLDVHDSVPETFATKFSDGTWFWKALCLEERLSALVAHRVICVNGPQRDALVARGIPKRKTFISMNVPDPRIFACHGARSRGIAEINRISSSFVTGSADSAGPANPGPRIPGSEQTLSGSRIPDPQSPVPALEQALSGSRIPDPGSPAPALGQVLSRSPIPDPRSRHASVFDLVYHGTMAERLGVDLVIRAVAKLRIKVPCARLHLWGHGDDLDRFQALARELGVEASVLFIPGGYPLEELPERLSAMTAGVVGNRRSVAGDLMLPVKLLEYVSLEIPAIVPRLTTIAHYFSDDMVTYFEPEDVDSLAAAMYRLYADPELCRRQALRARRFLDDYGWERQGTELLSMYAALRNRNSPRG